MAVGESPGGSRLDAQVAGGDREHPPRRCERQKGDRGPGFQETQGLQRNRAQCLLHECHNVIRNRVMLDKGGRFLTKYRQNPVCQGQRRTGGRRNAAGLTLPPPITWMTRSGDDPQKSFSRRPKQHFKDDHFFGAEARIYLLRGLGTIQPPEVRAVLISPATPRLPQSYRGARVQAGRAEMAKLRAKAGTLCARACCRGRGVRSGGRGRVAEIGDLSGFEN